MQKTLPCFSIVGPTGVGKTALALRLHEYLPVEIISMDSVQIYQHMNIGSAKPTPDILHTIPHHLINICAPDQHYSVSSFLHSCHQAIQEIRQRAHIPVIVGGTMMYYHALLYGLDIDLPRSETIRQDIQARAHQLSWSTLYHDLSVIDPVSAQTISPRDYKRIERALEVFYLSGQTLSSLKKRQAPLYQPVLSLALLIHPSEKPQLEHLLRERINSMFHEGFIEEVQSLLSQYPQLTASHPSMRAVGYRETLQFLQAPTMSLSALKERILISTRQLVKKQLTWLKRLQPTFDIQHQVFHDDAHALYDKLLVKLERFFLNHSDHLY